MSTNIVDISAYIVTKLQSISYLNGVYEYIPDTPDEGNYPFATVHLDGVTGEFGDNRRNERIYTFFIDIFIDRAQASMGNQRSETLLRLLGDSVLTVFDNDTTLGGLVKFVRPVSIQTSFESTDIGDTRVARIVIEALNIVDSLN